MLRHQRATVALFVCLVCASTLFLWPASKAAVAAKSAEQGAQSEQKGADLGKQAAGDGSAEAAAKSGEGNSEPSDQTSNKKSATRDKPARRDGERPTAVGRAGKESQADASDVEGDNDAAGDSARDEKTGKKTLFAPVGASRLGTKPPCPVQSIEEVQVLLHLRERHTVLLARESELAQREVKLQKFEATLREKMSHLSVTLASIEAALSLGAAGEKAREARLQSLVDTVSTLSAKKAAPMLAQADPVLVAELFRRLGPTRASSLLAVMPAAKAGKLIDFAAGDASQVMSHAAKDASKSAAPTK